MSELTRQCPHPGCDKRIRSDFFMCGPHWHALPEPEKEIVTTSYSDWQQGNISVDQLRQYQGMVIGRLQERIATEPATAPTKIVPTQSVCRSCGRKILWALTGNDKRIPLDPEPVVNGNLEVDAETGRVRTLKAAELNALLRGGNPLYHISHFATCPNANKHRIRR